MAKQLNVNLSFNANTSQAKAEIQSLVSELNKLSSGTNLNSKGLPLTKDLIEAQNAAKQLGIALDGAFDVNTGTLDLSSFNQSLQKSGMSLKDYSTKLTLLGQEGDQAFLKVAQSIVNTQAPLRKTNSMLVEFATTLKNTARWQVSSSILHGFMGAVQSAYGYAQDLNKSLNNIRIVTGYNADQMSVFAEQANKAAKALSTTTTKYTDASLIYYQQGLDESEVSKRSDITVKMANVAGQSAQIVSDQLTAVWNNFYDGSKSLEYYADVMTALGAATASSTDEIAGGLEKFAAVADTIGLSYEYAASALATITSNTRQSEEVVGTALKTIFARIQGLNLGETLDDGTTLNKYSEALDKVGISIFDNAGELKKMDLILEEMAEKWDSLSNNQQVALAQTVAGVRQYNQLVSLMDNWDNGDSDSMTANLQTSYNSTGALQEQADIYAESWEASRDRVKASLEGIYQTLIDDDFFIELNNMLSKLIDGIDSFIDSIGGAKGVILLLGSVMTRVFAEDIAKGINNAVDNMRILSGTAKQEIAETQKMAKDIAISMTKDLDSRHIDAMRQALETTYSAQEELRQSAKFMSADQLVAAENAIKTAQSYNDIAIAAGKAADEARRAYEEQSKNVSTNQGAVAAQRLDQISTSAVTDTGSDLIRDAYAFIDVAKEMGLATDTVLAKIKEYQKAIQENDETKKTNAITGLMQAMDGLVKTAADSGNALALYQEALGDSAEKAVEARSNFDKMKNSIEAGTFNATRKDLEKLATQLSKAGYNVKEFRKNIKSVASDKMADAFTGINFSLEDMNGAIEKTAIKSAKAKGGIVPLTDTTHKLAMAAGEAEVRESSAKEALDRAGEAATIASGKIRNLSLVYQSLGSALTGGLQGVTSLASGLISLKSAFDTLNNPDLGTFEKYTSILMSLGTAIPMITTGFKNLGNVLKFVASSQKEGLTAQLGYLLGLKSEEMQLQHLVVSKTGEIISRHASAEAAAKEAIGISGATTATEINTAATWKNIGAKLIQHWYILVIVAALAALAAAVYFAVEAYNEEANAAKRAAEATEELSESQKELEEKSTKLKNTWEAYETAVEKLEECTKGTKEWEEALKAVNDAAQDVLDVLPSDLSADEIKSLYSTDKGYLELNSEKISEYQNRYDKAANTAQYAAQSGKVSAALADLEADTVEAVRNLIATQNSYALNASSGGYAPIASNGEYVSYLNEDVIKENILNNIDDWTGLDDNEFKNKLEALGVQTELLSNETLTNFQTIVEQLGNDAEAASEKMRLIAKLQVEEQLGDNYDDASKAISAEKLADRTQELQDAYLELYTSNSGDKIDFGNGKIVTSTGINQGSNENNAIYQEALKDLQEAGYDYDEAQNGVQGNDNNRYFVFTDEDGDTKKRTAEWVAETVAASKALAELEGIATNAADALANMESIVGEQTSSAIKNMITSGNLDSLTEGELSNLKAEMDSGADGTVSADDATNYLRTAFADYTDEEIAQMFGKNSIEEAGKMWSDVITSTSDKWNKVGDNFVKTVDNALSNLDLSELSMEEAKNLGSILNRAFINMGSEGVDIISDIFTQATANGFGDEFIDALSNIDWNSVTPSALNDSLHDAGINMTFTDEQLQLLIASMRKAGDSALTASDQYKTLHEVIDDLKTGDIIDAEAFNNLGAGMDQYFLQMADGTYQLIADAEEFYNFINSQSIDKFKAEIASINQNNSSIQNVLDQDISSISAVDGASRTMGGHYYTGNGWALNKDVANAQLDFLDVMGGADAAQVQQWREDLQKGVLDVQAVTMAVNEQVETLGGAKAAEEALTIELQKNNEALAQNQEKLASTASNMDELNQLWADGLISAEAYGKALESIGAKEAAAYGLDPEEFENLSDMIEQSGDAIEGLSKDLKGNKREANDVAKALLRYDKAVSSINDSYEDWIKTLKSGNLQDQAAAIDDIREAYGNLMDIDGDVLSDSFIKNADNLALMQQAAQGSEEAYNSLMLKMQEDIIAHCDLDTTKFNAAKDALDMALQELGFTTLEIGADLNTQAALDAMSDLVNAAGMTADQATTYLASMGVDAEVVEDKTQTSDPTTYVSAIPTIRHNMYMGTNPITGFPQIYSTPSVDWNLIPETDESTKTTTAVGLKVVSANKSSGGNFKHTNSSSGSGVKKPSSSGGGGGSAPKAPSKTEKRDTTGQADVVERYREVNDAIDNVADALTRAERATNRLWGKDKLDAMRQENKILAEQYKLLQQKAQEAEDYAKQDYNDLMDVADEIGVSVVVDANTGDITNIEDVEKTLYDRLAAAEAEYNRKVAAYNSAVTAAGNSPTEAKVKELEAMKEALDTYEKDIIEGIENDISTWEDAEQQFQDSVETWEDAGLEAEDILDQMMQKNFDIWSESLQLEVEINDKDLELLDYYLSKIEDNVYEMAEAAALMVGNLSSGFEGGQLGEYLDNLSIYGEKYAELTDRLNSTDPEYQITSAQYKEGLDEIQSGLLDNLSSIQELDDAMMEYYGETLSMVGEEIDKYSEKMEHQTSILEHYANMMEILGKSQDYEAMGTILEGQVKTIQNELDVAEAEYNLYAEEAEKKRKLYEEAVASGDVAAAELYKGEWEAAEEAAMEAQSNMLDKTEQWAEAMKAVVENKLQGLAKSLEEALTGGTSFEQINTQLERAASLQEEYLTTTNQIYETNKLMRTAQQEIDKSTNTVAKQRLKDFIKETDQLQDKSKLSKYELDIQKAKYDLLLAEIALEDAQNAKSTVRLQRDSEGNMGYVYTADQSKLAEAQQQLEDAQNSLYNIGLEGANNYTEKYAQTMEEMYDTLTSITEAYYNGEITSKEEYDRQMLEAQEYYYQQLEDYQDLYGVALQTDTRVIKDAWSSGFNSMINSTQTWKDKVKVYSDEAAKTMADWYSKVENISTKTGLDNIANKVKGVTDESKALKDTILGVDGSKGVIGALVDELTAVGDLTGGYATLRGTIQGLIGDYEKLMTTVNNAQNQQQEVDNKNQNGTGGTSGDSDSNNGDTSSNTGNGGSTSGSNAIGTGTGSNEPTISTGTAVTVKRTATHFSRDGGNGTRMRSFVPGGNYNVMEYDDDEVLIGKGGVATGWVKKTDLVGFNTGGYTGSWGSYGKLAILDEKELVLNQNDTANFLASMEVLERILEIIDLQSASAQLGGMLHTPTFGSEDTTQMLEQSVHIEASFPGVSDRNEIEEAFNNLINTASQYANRKW